MDPPNYQKYGVPFYSVAWLPALPKSTRHDHHDDDVDNQKNPQAEETHTEPDTQADDAAAADDDVKQTQSKSSKAQTELAEFDPNQNHVVLAGGGGEGRSGVPNAILVAQFDPASVALSRHPVANSNTGSDLPYRMAVHPGGDGLICAFTNSCRWFEFEEERSGDAPKLGVKQSERVLDQLEDVGQQLALTFDKDGSFLAAGGEDGKLRVFKWPSMEIILDEEKAHTSVKQLDFSPDGKFLVSLGSSGPGRVWDVSSSAVVASLPAEKGEVFCSCRFSVTSDGNRILYIADKSGRIVIWNTTTWKRIGSKNIASDIIAFDVSADGKLLACGTAEGDILIVNSTRMRVQKVVKKAHLGFVTALSFSRDSRALASASMDSSARVSTVENDKKSGGVSLWVIILIILVAIAAYFLNDPQNLPSFKF